MENNTSSLDPLGPEFGKVQGPAINSQSLSPFEGEELKENTIDFFPVAASIGTTTHPNYPIQDAITGHAPFRPSNTNPNKKLTVKEQGDAFGARMDMFIKTHQDKNSYAKVNVYNAGPSGNSFYKRYAAYGQKKFDEIGFSPTRDNEAMYNAHTTMGDDFTRMMKNSFVPLFARGFVSGPKSLIKMLQGDFSADLDDARAYEEAAAIGQSSKKGMGAFFNNTAMSFAYTAGIITEAILEEAAGVLLAPVTGGGSFFAATANNARKVGKIGDAFELATKGYNAVRRTIKEANTIGATRNLYTAAKNIGASKVGKFLNPFENAVDAIAGIGKNADNLTGLARLAQGTTKTAGGLFRDIRNINMALSEARLEGGMNDNKVYDTLYDDFYKRNDRAPNNEEQYEITKTAKESGTNTLMWNTALIFATNKVVIPNLLKSGVGKRIINSKIDDVLAMKGGKIILEKTAVAGKKLAQGEFTFVADSFKNSLKGFKKTPFKTSIKVAGKYMKANLMEGVQENLQDVITIANEKYYIDAYKNKELGAHIYNKGKASLMFSGLKDQVSWQGLETFASGALMGVFSGGLNLVKGGLDAGYNNIFNKEEYNKYKDLRKTHGDDVAKELTALYKDPKEFFSSRLFNYGVQNNTVSNVDEADTKEGKDELSDAFVSQVYTALNTDTIEYFKNHIGSMKDLSVDEFEEAFGFEKGKGAKQQDKIDNILSSIDEVKKSYNYANERFPNPIDLSKYDKDLPEYRDAAILSEAWQMGIKNYVFANHSFMDNAKRMTSISGKILDNPSMKKMSQADMLMVFEPSKINDEIQLIKSEIEAYSQSTDPKAKTEILKKQNRVKALEDFSSAHSMYALYNNAEGKAKVSNELFEAVKQQQGVDELTDEDKEQILEIQKNAINNELEIAYKNYLKNTNGIDSTYIFDTDIDETFSMLKDHYTLSDEQKVLVNQINLLHDPQSFMDQLKKSQIWMSNMYNNRKDYFVDMVNTQINGLENNTFLNALADKNIFMDLDAFQDYMENDIPPKEFLNETTKQVIKPGSAEYAIIFNMLQQNKELKNNAPSKENFDEKLQVKLDELKNAYNKEYNLLPKTEVKTKGATVKKDNIKIKEIIDALAIGDYVEVTVSKTDKVVILYNSPEGLRTTDKNGSIIKLENIKNTFSQYTVYKIELKPSKEDVQELNKKYTALKKEAIDTFDAEKDKNELKQYSIYTELKDFPKDLYSQLQKEFNKSEALASAVEDEVSDEEISNMFKAFIEKDPKAKTIIDKYNDKNVEEVEKQKSGRIEDFDFEYNNKTNNTSKYSNEQIKTLSTQFKNFRDNEEDPVKKAYYSKIINDFEKLIATRLIKNFKPDIQETIRIIEEKLSAQQKNIRKIGQSGYLLKGSKELLKRVTNYTQELKSEAFIYKGKETIGEVFNSTIGATKLTKESIDAFMTEIDKKLVALDNSGYTKDTLDGVASSSNNLKKYLNEILANPETSNIKNKRDLLEAIQNHISENAYEYTRKAGTYLDEQLRNFFSKEKTEFKESEITSEAYDSMFGPTGFLKPIKQKIDSGELYVLAKGLVVFDEEGNVAGEMDLLLIDQTGKLHIIDFKTGEQKKWNGFVNKTESGLNKTEDYTLQQYTYARLLKKMTGLDAEINIMPLETIINQKKYQIISVKEPTNPELLGLDNWYFPLDINNPSFAKAKSKIDAKIKIETKAPGIKVATAMNPKLVEKLVELEYPEDIIKVLSKEDLAKIVDENLNYTEYQDELGASLNALAFADEYAALRKGVTEKETAPVVDKKVTTTDTKADINLISTPVSKIVEELSKLNTLNEKLDWLKNNNLLSSININGKEYNTIDYSDRVMVLMKIGKYNIPFYISTGQAGKKTVKAGNWYAVFGIGVEKGWINKGSEKQINNNYGFPVFEKLSKILNEGLGAIQSREDNGNGKLKEGIGFLSDSKQDLEAFNNNMNLSTKPAGKNTDTKDFYDHVNSTLSLLNNELKELSGVSTSTKPSISISADTKADIEKNLGIKLSDYIGFPLTSSGAMSWEKILSGIDNDGNAIPEQDQIVLKGGYDLGDGYFAIAYKQNKSNDKIAFHIFKKGISTVATKASITSSNIFSSAPKIAIEKINALASPRLFSANDTDLILKKIDTLKTKYDAELAALKTTAETADTVKPRITIAEVTDKLNSIKEANVLENYLVDLRNAVTVTKQITLEDSKIIGELVKAKKEEFKQANTVISKTLLNEGDVVVVIDTIPGKTEDDVFADIGAEITVVKSDKNGVEFTYNNKKKTLSLSELDKHISTIAIQKAKEAQKADEILDTQDKDLIAESLKVLKDFISNTKNIDKAKANVNDKTLTEIYDELLKDLDC